MRGSPRFWLQGFLVGALLATQTGVVAAQIPDPLDTGGGQLPNPVPTVEEVLQGAVDTVADTVNTAEDTVTTVKDTVEETAGQTTKPTQNVTNTNPVGTAKDATGGSTAGASNTLDAATGAVSPREATAGTAGTSPSGTASGAGSGSERTYTSATAGSLHNWIRARGLFNSAALLAGSQPSLAILVDALNDADGDGIFSDAENAPAPGADVAFKALVTNIGSTSFEIEGVSHTYAGPSGPAQGNVCGELVGLMLAPGESLACSFPVAGYAPAHGERLVNTVMAAAFEVGKDARRGASDSDTTAVETVVAADEVLAVAIKRNLAFTGTHAARLVALALVLLAMGGGSLSLARARARRPSRRLPSESSGESLGWSTLPATPRMKENAQTK